MHFVMPWTYCTSLCQSVVIHIYVHKVWLVRLILHENTYKCNVMSQIRLANMLWFHVSRFIGFSIRRHPVKYDINLGLQRHPLLFIHRLAEKKRVLSTHGMLARYFSIS